MKQTFLNTAFMLTAMTFTVSNATAQITINLSKILKLKKPVITKDTATVTDNTVTTNTTNTATGRTDGNGSTNWWIDYQIEAITK